MNKNWCFLNNYFFSIRKIVAFKKDYGKEETKKTQETPYKQFEDKSNSRINFIENNTRTGQGITPEEDKVKNAHTNQKNLSSNYNLNNSFNNGIISNNSSNVNGKLNNIQGGNINKNHSTSPSPQSISFNQGKTTNEVNNNGQGKEGKDSKDSKGPTGNIQFNYDPKTGEVGDVKVDVKMTIQDAKKLYETNKQYLPSKEQIIDGAKATNNAVQKSGILENKEKKDPLTNLFGIKK